MSFRSDISVDWSASPRIIEVAAPSAELKLQDLHDTLRTLAAQPQAMDEASIIESAGKEYLSDEASVGLTTTLLNARVKFEDRGAPPWTACVVKGGNLVAKDALGEPMDSIEPAAYVQVTIAQSSSPTIVFGSGSGITEQDKLDIADCVWNDELVDHVLPGTFGVKSQKAVPSENAEEYKADVSVLADVKAKMDTITWEDVTSLRSSVDFLRDMEGGRWQIVNNQMVFYKADNKTVIARFNLYDERGLPATKNVFERRRA